MKYRITPIWVRELSPKGRCCGRKPIEYKRDPHLYCPRCNRSFDPNTKDQIANWAWEKDGAGFKPTKLGSVGKGESHG